MLNVAELCDYENSSLTSSSYFAFPQEKPFINSKLTKNKNKKNLSKAFPESNRDAIIETLRNMQTKLKKLDIDDVQQREQEVNTHDLEKKVVNSTLKADSNNSNTNLNSIELIAEKTLTTEKRVYELEKQLAKMKQLLNKQDMDTNRNESNSESPNLVQSSSSDNFIESNLIKRKQNMKQQRSKSESRFANCNHYQQQQVNQVNQHYRLNIGDIPFVVGKSTTQSHHLGTNIQNVISLLKTHNPKICCSSSSQNQFNNRLNKEVNQDKEVLFNKNSLNQILNKLHREYSKLVVEHYDLTKRIIVCCDYEIKKELEYESYNLEKRIKKKNHEIKRIKHYLKNQKGLNDDKEQQDCKLNSLKLFKSIKSLQSKIKDDQL